MNFLLAYDIRHQNVRGITDINYVGGGGQSQKPETRTLEQLRYQRSLRSLSTRPRWFPCLGQWAMNMKNHSFK